MVEAQGDEEQLALVQDVLGESSTEYGTWNTNRSTNISVGASRLNGIVLYPGEELSVGDTMAPFTAEEGYLPAASYEMGSVVDSYGGGICQVSTTLDLAVLRSELEVTERYSHSMTVSYVKPSMDAAIAEGVKDFKFVNNTDAPIYIEASAGDGEVAFAIYGHETGSVQNGGVEARRCLPQNRLRPLRWILLSYGSVTETSSGHTGSSARLWKIVM
ncbi:MAG: VanW family protein [Eisenbergiella sp.]